MPAIAALFKVEEDDEDGLLGALMVYAFMRGLLEAHGLKK